MVRGAKPLPTALKMIKGERADRINFDEPQPEQAIPDCPSRDPDVIAVWDYYITQLTKMRVVTMADRDSLAAFCEAVVIFREASELLRYQGLVREDGVRNPAGIVHKEASLAIRQLGAEFGFSPAARSRIKVADQRTKPVETSSPARLLSS